MRQLTSEPAGTSVAPSLVRTTSGSRPGLDGAEPLFFDPPDGAGAELPAGVAVEPAGAAGFDSHGIMRTTIPAARKIPAIQRITFTGPSAKNARTESVQSSS